MNCDVLNAPAQIQFLREKGIEIETVMQRGINKWGDPVRWALYRLKDLDKAKKIYKHLNKL